MKNYYITGASGHLGRNIVLDILNNEKEDFQIIALILENEKYLDFNDLNKKITFVTGNVLSIEDCLKFLSTKKGDKNIVIHSAGLISIYKNKDPKVMSVNINGTKNMLDASLKNHIDKFIYISSVDCIIKEKTGIVKEPSYFDENMVQGVYAKSKAIATNCVLSYNNLGLETITIHPSALVGPNDYFKGPINLALSKFYKGKLPAIVTGGYNIVDARDVAHGIVAAANSSYSNTSYIMSGTSISIKDLMNLSSKITSKPSYKICVPSTLVKIFSPFIELFYKIRKQKPLFTGYSMTCLHQNFNYTSEKAEKELNYNSRNFEDTLKDTFKWIEDNKW